MGQRTPRPAGYGVIPELHEAPARTNRKFYGGEISGEQDFRLINDAAAMSDIEIRRLQICRFLESFLKMN